MRTLRRKVLRDLWGLRGQALAIAFVIAGGVATLVMSLATLHSLRETQASFYRERRFADAFCALKRAPEGVAARLAAIPGVERVTTRVVAPVNLDIPDYPDPVTGLLVSLPDQGEAALNAIHLRRGRRVAPGRDDEVVLSEAFADAQGLGPGSTLTATVNGRRKRLHVVGVALSPDFIFQIRPGSILPDFERYGILWMARTPLSVAYDMEGAFNEAALALGPEAKEREVLDRIDDLLARYGGLGAYGRRDQLSHRFLHEEFRQLAQMARVFPTIFLGVAAFLLNVVVGRLVRTQREQIAALKAFGYSNLEVGLHYLQLVLSIVAVGLVLGVAGGGWLGKGLSDMYMEFYRFPYLVFELAPRVVLLAAGVTVGAAVGGTVFAVRQAAALPPAEAMRPEPPARYRISLVERFGLGRFLAPPTRMIVRNLERRPVKTGFSILGIALACSILMVGSFFWDSVEFMVQVIFGRAQREDATVTFVEPSSRRAIHELAALPGVERVEPFRSVPVILRRGHRSYRTGIQGVQPRATLHRLLDHRLRAFEPPPAGILITDYLGEVLDVRPGERLEVEVLEGSRPRRSVPVAGFVKEFMGVSGYMTLDALNRLLGEGDAISGAYLATDSLSSEALFAELDARPRVAGTVRARDALVSFRDVMRRQLLTFAFFNVLLAASIACGVVYNSARIALSERSRELASLRVLGLTRGEVSYVLLGELGLLTLLAIPLGQALGLGLCWFMSSGLETDLFRIPFVVEARTFAIAATVVLVSATFSALIVRRRIDRLDLVEVLKTRE